MNQFKSQTKPAQCNGEEICNCVKVRRAVNEFESYIDEKVAYLTYSEILQLSQSIQERLEQAIRDSYVDSNGIDRSKVVS